MVIPSLPAANSVSWYSHYAAIDDASRSVIQVGAATGSDTAAIDAALAAVPSGGIIQFSSGGAYTTTGGHVVPPGVSIRAHGATVTHTGNNTCFNFNQTGSFNLDKPTGIHGLRLIGNSGASAVGIEVGNCWGWYIALANIAGYSGGRGILVNNVTNWCEGMNIDGVKIDGCAVALQFRRTTGTFSFAYLRTRHLSVNVPASGIGIDLGGDSSTTCYFYNSDIEANIWIGGNNAVGVRVSSVVNSDNIRCNIVGEIPGGPIYTGMKGLSNEGGTFKAFGRVNIKDSPNDVALGFTRILVGGTVTDGMSGTAASETYQTWLAANEDVSHNAQMGYIYGTSRSIPFVSGYNGGDVFRVYSVATSGSPSTGTKRFNVDGNGYVEVIGGGWNNGCLRLGNNSIWVDSLGKLRIKVGGYPASDTDGVVVGSQT